MLLPFHANGITCLRCTLFQNHCKNPLARHDAVSRLLANSTIRVALLADLGNLTERRPNAQPGANRQMEQLNSFTEDILRKRTGKKPDRDLFLKSVHALTAKQTYLPMPVPRMRIAGNSDMRDKVNFLHRTFLLPFFLADTNSFDDSLFLSHVTPLS